MDKKLIKQGEGYRPEVYRCTQGHPTIGYGHKIVTQREKQTLKIINEEKAEQLLQADLVKAKNEIKTWFGQQTLSKIGPERQAVLIDMAFNLGSVRWPKLTQAIKKENYQKAAFEILNSKYATQVGNRAIRNAQIMKQGKLLTKQEALKQRNKIQYGELKSQKIQVVNRQTIPISTSTKKNTSINTPTFNVNSDSNSGFGLSNDRSNVGYSFKNGSRISGGYSRNGPEISIYIPCQII